jgi:D-serine deaminase-like pyridoxal phosphate-dependent protein
MLEMNSRRSFLSLAAALPAFAKPAAKSEAFLNDFEAKIRRKDFRNITLEDLPTPAMVLDLDLFEANLKKMAEHCKQQGIHLRAHVKIHKSPEVSKRQVAAGAIGVCCATIAECELMVNHGLKGVLFTCQPTGKNKISRVVALSKYEPTFMTVVDDPIIATQLQQAAAAAGTKVNVVVDVFAGLTRQGCPPGDFALKLAQQVDSSKNLNFAGLMAYSGWASHTKTFAKRAQRSKDDLAGMLETAELCKKSGLAVNIKTGGSTGTYNIDVGSLTELQAGSYIFMDTLYVRIGGRDNDDVYTDFKPALTVLSTVVSKQRDGRASIDAGNKAMLKPTDEVKGRPEVKIENQGAEYGMLVWKDGDRDYKVGDKVEIYPSNLDTSTNVYDRYYVARNNQIVDVWPIMDRAGAPQR